VTSKGGNANEPCLENYLVEGASRGCHVSALFCVTHEHVVNRVRRAGIRRTIKRFVTRKNSSSARNALYGLDFGRFLSRHAFGMAIDAFDKVNVVGTLGGFEGRVHGFDVHATIGELRMAIGTGGPRLLAMALVAREAAESFVNTDGSPVIAGADLQVCEGSVALVAESLSDVGTDLDRPIAVMHGRK